MPCRAGASGRPGDPLRLPGRSVVACDHITTIPAGALGRRIGVLLDQRERALSNAIRAAFDLD